MTLSQHTTVRINNPQIKTGKIRLYNSLNPTKVSRELCEKYGLRCEPLVGTQCISELLDTLGGKRIRAHSEYIYQAHRYMVWVITRQHKKLIIVQHYDYREANATQYTLGVYDVGKWFSVVLEPSQEFLRIIYSRSGEEEAINTDYMESTDASATSEYESA